MSGDFYHPGGLCLNGQALRKTLSEQKWRATEVARHFDLERIGAGYRLPDTPGKSSD
jgi:hypothetical protein